MWKEMIVEAIEINTVDDRVEGNSRVEADCRDSVGVKRSDGRECVLHV